MMILHEIEGVMTASVISSEDSGYDNGFLSDSSSSSGTLDCCQRVCVFSGPNKEKKVLKDAQHTCALNSYDISGHNIEVISPRTFQYFTNCIKLLNLSNNNIKTLPETLCEMKNLEVLNLSVNDLQSVPASWKVLHKLKVLNLSQNLLNDVPQCLELGMERVTHIDLSNNKISKFVNPPLCLPSLQCLNISHNLFVTFPLWLFSEQCRSILDLDVSFNFCFDDLSVLSKVTQFKHHRTSALKLLQKINISNTGIKPDMIKCLSHFQSLECFYMGNVGNHQRTYNHIWEIPINIFYNPLNVFELHIPSVGLAGLPDEFCRLENLKLLDLSHNQLDWLPDNFGVLKNLEILILSECNLSYLPDNFNHLSSLKKLLLDSNKLTSVHNQVTGLTALEWLDLYDNNLEEFPLTHSHVKTLSKLDVAFNCVDLESALDCEEGGERLLDIYVRLQANLRASDGKYTDRVDHYKVFSNSSSWDSSESLHHHRSYYSDDDLEMDNPVEDQEQTCVREEENWDDDSSCGEDYFDPNIVERYYLQPGRFKFGWKPPIKQRECVVPMKMLLSGFIYIPGETHTKTSRRRRLNIRLQPTVDGQFDDSVGESADEHEEHPMRDVLKKKCLFIRNPNGPSKIRRCRFCSIYEDCWHHGVWLRF